MARILIVENDQIIQMDLYDRVQDLGYTVAAVATSADEAVTKARTNAPDLILMDIGLEGGQSGIDAALRIRMEQQTPIIYLTALAEIRNLGRAAGTEPYFYLVKPVRLSDLATSIETALTVVSEVPRSTSQQSCDRRRIG